MCYFCNKLIRNKLQMTGNPKNIAELDLNNKDYQTQLTKVPVLLSPTASGKSSLALFIAQYIDSEIISTDSRQIYKYLDIGTAKPSHEELALVPHHFIDILDPDEYYSAGIFGDQAYLVLSKILENNKIPIVAGGSGLYVKALCEGLFHENYESETRVAIREKLNLQFENEGIDNLYADLEKYDPQSAKLYADKNPRRVIRALEYYYSNGKLLSEAQAQSAKSREGFEPVYFCIDHQRAELYDKINQRCEQMWDNGLVEETEKVLKMGFSPELNSLNTVGYKEAIAFIQGKMNKSEALEKMKQSTRNYAKRQMTWIRGVKNVLYINGTNQQMMDIILNSIQICK
jgi:tRNA dimethylallyltransferase